MPSLAGIFGRKNKSSPKLQENGQDISSALSSPTGEYVTPDRSLPSSPNGASTLHPDSAKREPAPSSVYPSLAQTASSSKIRLPFSRKKAAPAASTTSVVTTFSNSQGSNFGSPPRAPHPGRTSTSTTSDAEVDSRRLLPPPSKSAIFAAYTDPQSALSTRSLPTEPLPLSFTASSPTSAPAPPKKPGFFHWSKSSPNTLTKPKPKSTSPAQSPPTSPSSDQNSFNLKSFRHVGTPTAAITSPNDSNISLSPPIPRPRGTSTASDASQRISVAAFREAHARRSAAGSPVPSNRAPSPGPLMNVNYPNRPQPHKRSMSNLAYNSDSDESEPGQEDADSDHSASPPTTRPKRGDSKLMRRKRTFTKHNEKDRPPVRATKSEMGHGTSSSAPMRRDIIVPAPRSQSKYVLLSEYPPQSPEQQEQERARSQSSLGLNSSARPRASASTSALSPSAAAQRASILASANAHPLPTGKHTRTASAQSIPATSTSISAPLPPPRVHTPVRPPSSASNYSDDSDDAPLATLVPPKRPGSAMSSASNPSLRPARAPPKPLIDITQLTTAHPRQGMHRNSQSIDGFTPGSTLLSNAPVQTSMSPPTRFVSPPSSPPREFKQLPQNSVSPANGNTGAQLRSAGGAPIRRETSPVMGSGGDRERERDGLGERLTRVAQLRTKASASASIASSGSGSTTASGYTGPHNFSMTKSTTLPPPTTTAKPQPPVPVKAKSLPPPMPEKLSPPEEDLVAMLGDSIHLIRRTGESASESDATSESSEESDDSDKPGLAKTKDPNRIAPIPIKERAPPPAFSVTSRPPLKRPEEAGGGDRTSVASSTNALGYGRRKRSSTLVPSSSSSSASLGSSGPPTARPGILTSSSPPATGKAKTSASPMTPTTRKRSSTLIPTAVSSSSLNTNGKGSSGIVAAMPMRHFASARQDSPASSTGDSSSGRAPFTPRDGSEVGMNSARSETSGWSGGVSGLSTVKGRHMKRRSVSFEDDMKDVTKSKVAAKGKDGETINEEERRKERRRSEAKAAIELGNVINGRGPILSDDDDDDLPINQTLGAARMNPLNLNPMMAMGGMNMGFGPPGWNMNMQMNMMGQNPGMGHFMPPNGADPNFMAAHQQAMMFAKQAYQMAVAQQAMAAAGDEWERGSAIGGFSSGGSVYGGTSPSVVGSSYGLNPMMGMGMGMGVQHPGNGWSTGSVMFPGPARSMYGGSVGGISGARSDYGGGGGGGMHWSSSKSSYGESYSPSSNRHNKPGLSSGRPVYGQRDSSYVPPLPPIPPQSSSPSRGTASPRARTTSQPSSPSRGARKAAPPSSWKAGV
ncbi:hypothetical protein H0H81_008821 [Sphagnurus paluster]|uniref:Uncharacterized protein n=1 Tax=Sphagnurus paluster TaxID=117069 RepID=A0A9P7K872_9AGAR|nr:hypothetical protein H0H81_008821 [Sphagnurus paluster]